MEITVKTYLIYTLSIDKGQKLLNELVKGFKEYGYEEIIKRKNSIEIQKDDIVIYFKIVKASDKSRGYKWDYAYVDFDIPFDIFLYVIRPSQSVASMQQHPYGKGVIEFFNVPEDTNIKIEGE